MVMAMMKSKKWVRRQALFSKSYVIFPAEKFVSYEYFYCMKFNVALLIFFFSLLAVEAQIRPKKYYHPPKLEKNEITIDAYDMHQCHVANWMRKEDFLKMPRNTDKDSYREIRYISNVDFFLEPEDSIKDKNIYDEWDGSFTFIVRLTGRFYTEKGYPLNYREKEHHQPARVFRYRKFEVVSGAKKL